MLAPASMLELSERKLRSQPGGVSRCLSFVQRADWLTPSWILLAMIIWLNGAFRAGKTTLAEELHRRLPAAVVFNPEDVGLMLWKWLEPNDDFQDLASWRELVVATAVSLRRHHAGTLIVPMSLIRESYRIEILGGLVDAGEEVLHVFLEADAGVLRGRLAAREDGPKDPEGRRLAGEWALRRIDAAIVAAGRQPPGTLMLRSDRLTPADLANEVLAVVGPRELDSGG